MTEPVTIHGIRNCDTMKKARAWLEGHGVAHAFHDYKVAGIDRATLEAWARKAGWEKLLNRAGTTFRKLPEAGKQDLTEAKAIALMLAQPGMIKRPVLVIGKEILVGFDPARYAQALGAHAGHPMS
ncbi:ArsC family reductase [Neoroseomonas soli]|uniref:ArsC family reductase n=1 Tax=Neoroseomonas soli TaxID=1081025 RepID=A0A9X9WUT4_9PROT|nr:ArsC family reductase [Neoroseomonas soli]MBR0670913.1 ArsC family reductase [Neoroseomonas soli]